jgi:hypothetical protein
MVHHEWKKFEQRRKVVKRIIISILLICLTTLGCAPYMIMEAEKQRRQQAEPIYRIYPYSRDRVVWITYALCDEAYGIESYTEAEGVLTTNWVTVKYPSYETPPDFVIKMKQYGSPLFPTEKRWSGMRHKYIISFLDSPQNETHVEVLVILEGYNWFYKSWRWWNSKGMLELLLLAEIEQHLKQEYGPP